MISRRIEQLLHRLTETDAYFDDTWNLQRVYNHHDGIPLTVLSINQKRESTLWGPLHGVGNDVIQDGACLTIPCMVGDRLLLMSPLGHEARTASGTDIFHWADGPMPR